MSSRKGKFNDTKQLRDTMRQLKTSLGIFMKPLKKSGCYTTGEECDDDLVDSYLKSEGYKDFVSMYIWLEVKDYLDQCGWLYHTDQSDRPSREVKKRKIDRGTLDELLAIGKLVDAMKADPSEIERNRAEKDYFESKRLSETMKIYLDLSTDTTISESQRAQYREKFNEIEQQLSELSHKRS